MSIVSTVEKDGKKLISVLELVARDADKGLVVAVKYLPEASVIAGLLFPGEATAIAAGTSVAINVANVIQTSVAEVEAKAKLIPAGLTGAQKSADVLVIVEQTVLSQLATLGVKNADTSYVQSLVNAVVALLNIPSVAA
jgi:hypothetical protein